MLRRPATRLELKAEDVEEYEEVRRPDHANGWFLITSSRLIDVGGLAA